MFALRRLFNSSHRTKAFALALVLSLTAALLLANARAQQSRNPSPRPVPARVQQLDPLTQDEMELATSIASNDARVKEALGPGRQQLIRVEFLALKWPGYREAREPEQLLIGRHAFVILYNYEKDLGIHVVIDLEKKSVGEITKIDGKSVPLGATEVAEAFNLALRNERVRLLLGPSAAEFKVAGLVTRERPENRVEGLRIVAASPRDPCYRHRCIDLIFHRREGYLAGTQVTVDLTAQTVRVERTAR